MKTTLLFAPLIFFTALTFAEVRFVSKTGSSTPPYTSWATASDSIQKCINICNDGDTVVVANGVYKESLVIYAAITLLGSSMDNCVIDGTGLGQYYTIEINKQITLKGFNIMGKGISDGTYYSAVTVSDYINASIISCRISNSNIGIYFGKSSGTIDGVILTNVGSGVETFCIYDTCKPKINNCLILTKKNNGGGDYGIYLDYGGGQPVITDNIVIALGFGYGGIDNGPIKSKIITNNLIAGFNGNLNAGGVKDTAFIVNNICSDYKIGFTPYASIEGVSNKTVLLNNIMANNDVGVEVLATPIRSDYNLYWNNQVNAANGLVFSVNDVFADPMFVKDTVASSLNYDYHLQKYSPAIDAGDPTILDKDESRSDIGMYGGALGITHKYLDLPPKPPHNFVVSFDTAYKKVSLNWDRFSEADFNHYVIYRSPNQGFIPDTTSKYAEVDTSYFTDILSSNYDKCFYKITAIDSSGNESIPGPEITVIITDIKEPKIKIANEYQLYQNFPNPFNPVTFIPFSLAKTGYVKIMLYDIRGELVKTIMDDEAAAGYHQVEFNAGNLNLASGIYFFRIEVIGGGQIPVYMQMKKMIYLK